jgi:group I intron endonuclease
MEHQKPIRNMKDYGKGKIYIIRNNVNDMIYIGSTCQTLSQRMAQHRQDANKQKRQHYKLYEAMREHGKETFYIELVEDYGCERREQLLKREGEIIREHKAELNKRIEGQTRKEYREANKEANKEKDKIYCEKNKDKIKEYYEANKDKIKEYREANKDKIREYYEANKDKIREHYEANKNRISKQQKGYYEANKDKIKERRKTQNNTKGYYFATPLLANHSTQQAQQSGHEI